MRVLGIDPGFALMGYAVVQEDGSKIFRLVSGCVSTHKDSLASIRLNELYDGIVAIINEYKPTALAMERLFFNKNVTTAIKVGEARGVILLAAAQNNMDVFDYTPLQIKQAVCGYGRATKKQVQKMISLQMGIDNSFVNDDEVDALAVSLCHMHQRKWHEAVKRGDMS